MRTSKRLRRSRGPAGVGLACGILACGILSCGDWSRTAAPRMPNIVVILTDD